MLTLKKELSFHLGVPHVSRFSKRGASLEGKLFSNDRPLNRKRRIAFDHLLLELRTFVLAPEFCSVANPIENRSAIRLVVARHQITASSMAAKSLDIHASALPELKSSIS